MAVNKSKAAFRTIAEVAEELGVATHVLRFWETKFPQIKPMKRNGVITLYECSSIGKTYQVTRNIHASRMLPTLLEPSLSNRRA